MAEPAPGFVATRFQRPNHAREQTLEQGQRQASSGLTVGFAREVTTHQVGHMIAGRVAMEDLKEEGMHSHDWTQHALAPNVTKLATDPLDQGRLQVHGDIGLDRASAERILRTILGLLEGCASCQNAIFRETIQLSNIRT